MRDLLLNKLLSSMTRVKRPSKTAFIVLYLLPNYLTQGDTFAIRIKDPIIFSFIEMRVILINQQFNKGYFNSSPAKLSLSNNNVATWALN